MSTPRSADQRSPQVDEDRSRTAEAGLTRREVLLGGGALALAAAVAAALEHGRLVAAIERQATRLQGSHVTSSSGSTVVYRRFHSAMLGQAVDYGIALPPGVALGTALPVCFCLPGRGGGPDSVLGSGLCMADFLGEVVRGSTRPFALAAVAGGQTYWHRRASGEDRMAMLVEEFIPLCARRYHLGGSRARRAAMGWSMGGYGVLLAAETYPRLFSAVVATAPAVWPTYQDMMNGPRDAFDSAADFAAHNVIGHAQRLAGTPLLVECGTADPFYPFVRDLCQALPAGVHHKFSFGTHANAYWRGLEPAALRFIARHLGVM
jgi:enterochelin esterase-like enzyme